MVRVKVNEGELEGRWEENEFGKWYCSFKGIPYAEPPLGDLRFKPPQPSKPWQGVRSAKEFGSVNYQIDLYTREPPKGSEDCLYLNVYTPDIKPAKPLPVMFWIHGGGFYWGSGNDDMYGPEFLVRQGVVLVTFNYRLGILGFLCLHTADAPGNAGMKDQVAALRWVQNNIRQFGGDPENVTIFGESAGGASVGYHLISPMSKGLFKRAISQSGICNSSWSYTSKPREEAIQLAKKFGFASEDDKELLNFYKSLPTEMLLHPRVTTQPGKELVINELNFNVVSEELIGENERFFYGDFIEAFRNGIHEGVDVMNGYVENESLMMIGLYLKLEEAIYMANNVPNFFVPSQIAANCSSEDQMEVQKEMKRFYLKDQTVSLENIEELLKYWSFSFMLCKILEWQKLNAKFSKNKLYLYKFTCKSERNIFSHIFKIKYVKEAKDVVCHCDDLAYLFTNKIWPQKIDKNSRVFELIDQVTKLWTNFAKYGNPTPDGSMFVTWKPYTLQQENYLDIGQQLVPGIAPEDEEFQFWNSIFKKYLNVGLDGN